MSLERKAFEIVSVIRLYDWPHDPPANNVTKTKLDKKTALLAENVRTRDGPLQNAGVDESLKITS